MCLYVLFRLNSLHWEATLKEQKLMMTASASASQFLPQRLFSGLSWVYISGMQTGIPLGIQTGGN